jgi:hypothetical protein
LYGGLLQKDASPIYGASRPAHSTLVVDTEQRQLTRGQLFAFRDPDGDHFLARFDSVNSEVIGVNWFEGAP